MLPTCLQLAVCLALTLSPATAATFQDSEQDGPPAHQRQGRRRKLHRGRAVTVRQPDSRVAHPHQRAPSAR